MSRGCERTNQNKIQTYCEERRFIYSKKQRGLHVGLSTEKKWGTEMLFCKGTGLCFGLEGRDIDPEKGLIKVT